MKHDIKVTIQLLSWTIASLIIGILITERAYSVFGKELSGVNPILYGLLIIMLLGLTAIAWLKMMKHMKLETVDVVFSFGMGALASKAISLLLPSLFYSDNTILGFTVRAISMFGFWYIYLKLIRVMQQSWTATKRFTPVNNLIMITLLPVAATIIAVDLSIFVAMFVLAIAAIYDAWAVWRSKTMIKMANFFIKRRMIPGISIPKATEKKGFALLGGGDIFFIILVSATLYPYGIWMSLITTTTMFISVIILFLLSEKKKFYPALPIIFTGAAVGLSIILLLCRGGLSCIVV